MKYLALGTGLVLAASVALSGPTAAQTANPESYTGLVIDLGGKTIGQSNVLRLVSQDGRVVYGDTRRLSLANLSLLIEKRGMASYTLRWKEILRRCGSQPLIVQAQSVRGMDIIVSNEAADEITQADQRQHFLDAWQVSILSGDVQATLAQVAAEQAPTTTLLSHVTATPVVLAQAVPPAEAGVGWSPTRTTGYQPPFRRPPHTHPEY